jgi:membrane protease YdiL (CAAX protease family)
MRDAAKAPILFMTTDPQPALGFDPVTGQPLLGEQTVSPEKKLLAPVWHTVLIVAVVLFNSFFSARLASRATSDSTVITEKGRIVQYAATIVLEFFLLLLVWIGLRLKKVTIRELIGARWNMVEATSYFKELPDRSRWWLVLLLDVAIAIAFWMVALITLASLSYAVGLAKQSQIGPAKKLAGMIGPHSWTGLLIFIVLSITAGFVEEIIFRGYLQRQIAALSGNIYAGLIASAIVFGAAHGYEGGRRMMLICILGLMFGLLAWWRKGLRPGMIGHAWFDSFQGVLLFVATRTGILPGQ